MAVKSFRTGSGQQVDVEHASDEDFQVWIASHGIPVDDDGIAEWVFEDRVGVINHAISHGVDLKFLEENTSESEVFGSSKSALEANGA